MGRPKNFSREDVLERAIPVFWKHGFANTCVQELEKATSVNKSGLYSEFKDKADLFLASLRHYIGRTPALDVLSRQPQGWKNIEEFLKLGQTCSGQKGCFLVNCIREASDLPAGAKSVMGEHVKRVRAHLVENVRAAGHANPEIVADMIQTFHSGLALEQNIGVPTTAAVEKIENFLATLRR
jgi:AcrR family transcriptional regulator